MIKQVKDQDGYIIEIVEESAEKTATKKEETPKKEGKQDCNDKPKKKLHPMKIILPVVGGAAVIAGIIAGSVKIKHNSIENKYEALKSDTTIRTSSMYNLINPGRTSLDELLDQNCFGYNLLS